MIRWVVFCQADDEFATVSTLTDRVIAAERPWADGVLDHLRTWIGDPQVGEVRFVNLARLKDLPRTFHGTYDGNKAELNLGLKAISAAFLPPWRADGLILFRDADPKPDQPDRRAALEDARRQRPTEEQPRICFAVAHPEREAWYVAGFVPADSEEESRLEAERQRHGCWPHEESHTLLAGKVWDVYGQPILRNVKHVLRALTGADGAREAMCISGTDLTTLRERGRHNGLARFLADFAETLLKQVGS